MSAAEERLRPHPASRMAGDEKTLDLRAKLRALRAEPHSTDGHRQIALLHHGPVRLILYAFDEGGRIPSTRRRAGSRSTCSAARFA